jgi:RHS repeat-associated protein
MNLGCITTQGDLSPMHFTGKQHDYESGLDNFGARYYGSSNALGRFMTPDWYSKPTPIPYAELANPQSLNLYSYVNNNPLSQVDEDGHECPKCKTEYGGETKVGGDRSWRNNNPGNMTYSPLAKKLGAIGQDSGGFAIFPSMEAGQEAQDAQWQRPKYQDLSLEDAVKEWTKGDPPAVQAAYLAALEAAAGVPPGTKIRDLTPAQRQKMEDAQTQQEGNKTGTVVPKPTPAPTPVPPRPASPPSPPPPPPPQQPIPN